MIASPDPGSDRRRAMVVAGFAGHQAVARDGLASGDAEIAVLALGALERMGALTDTDLEAALVHPEAPVRRRAAELAARRPACSLLGALADSDYLVAEAAAWAAGERGSVPDPLVPDPLVPDPLVPDPLVEALCAMATGHVEPLCREAAVAALGALAGADGDPGLTPGGTHRACQAVLAATEDRPAVRRRAVIALAAFDGPEVDAALVRALSDRDWQVRQAAEDLAPDPPGS